MKDYNKELMSSNFIYTTDPETRKVLMSAGLLELRNNDGLFCFVNEPKKLFNFDLQKLSVNFSNTICL